MLKHPLLLVTFIALCGGVGAGCRYDRAPVEPRMDPFTPGQIHMDSEALRRDSYVGAPLVARDENDLLKVTVPIRSAIDKTLYVDYYITWLDRDGRPLGDKLGPKTKVLQANTPDSISITSTSPRAADFQLDLRYSR